MPNQIRSLMSLLNKSFSDRRSAHRQQARLPLTASLKIESTTKKTASAPEKPPKELTVTGYTRNVSKTGIAFVLPVIRLGENYLAGDKQQLRLKIELPGGTIEMIVCATRYETIGELDKISEYLFGTEILEMDEHDRELYTAFIKTGGKANTESALNLQAGNQKPSVIGQFFNL